MATLLFRLRGAPEDEVDDIQTLLDDNNIDWYATDAGNWGIAMPAIWLENESDHQRARLLIDTYQRERRTRVRAEQARLRAQGELPTLGRKLREKPLESAAIVIFSLFVLYVMIKPFVDLALAD
ncbi:MAG: hypothetical protein CSB44_08185 [Gammaproteobacteria bacterium]|nr:MAG: hypothetical protein CSB44_08185 [Gammaproteobacteria bacterium]